MKQNLLSVLMLTMGLQAVASAPVIRRVIGFDGAVRRTGVDLLPAPG